MRILFVCGRGLIRSATAELLFAHCPGVETASGGVSSDADSPLSAELVEWAELICVMEPRHREKLKRSFSRLLRGKRVVCLQIADEFAFMAPELVQLLRERVGQAAPAVRQAGEAS